MQVRGAPLIGITAAFGLARAIALDSVDGKPAARQRRPARHPPHRGQPALGPGGRGRGRVRSARPHDRADAALANSPAAARPGHCQLRPHRRARPGVIAGAEARGPAADHDPLQRRLAGDGGVGHGAGAGLQGPCRRHSRPCLGVRNPPPQPGHEPDRLGVSSARACPAPS